MTFVRRIWRPTRRTATGAMEVAGFGLLAIAAGLWVIPVGIAVAGLSCLALAWHWDSDDGPRR